MKTYIVQYTFGGRPRVCSFNATRKPPTKESMERLMRKMFQSMDIEVNKITLEK